MAAISLALAVILTLPAIAYADTYEFPTGNYGINAISQLTLTYKETGDTFKFLVTDKKTISQIVASVYGGVSLETDDEWQYVAITSLTNQGSANNTIAFSGTGSLVKLYSPAKHDAYKDYRMECLAYNGKMIRNSVTSSFNGYAQVLYYDDTSNVYDLMLSNDSDKPLSFYFNEVSSSKLIGYYINGTLELSQAQANNWEINVTSITSKDNLQGLPFIKYLASVMGLVQEESTNLLDFIKSIFDNVQTETVAHSSGGGSASGGIGTTSGGEYVANGYTIYYYDSTYIETVNDNTDILELLKKWYTDFLNSINSIILAIQDGFTSLKLQLLGLFAADTVIDTITDELIGKLENLDFTAPLNTIGELLQTKFPTSMIFGIIALLGAFTATAVTPVYTFNFPLGVLGSAPITLDLTAFDGIAQILRAAFLIVFIILLATNTKKHIYTGGGNNAC